MFIPSTAQQINLQHQHHHERASKLFNSTWLLAHIHGNFMA